MFYWRWFNRPRRPLMRAVLALVGAVLLVGVLALGFFALLALAFIGAIVAITRALARAAHHGGSAAAAHSGDARVLEGEFVVLNDTASLNR
jgi:hypothetical protein